MRQQYRESRRLDKGESLYAPRRDLYYCPPGYGHQADLTDQSEQAWRLTFLANCLAAWTTKYQTLARKRWSMGDELLARIFPSHGDNINFFGIINVDIEGRPVRTDRWPAGATARPATPARRATPTARTVC
ncbi:Tn3 family transposase [Actinoallomurus sp. CA-142502]|uniref:Tn3 family transposase n=1 Tax=Actinoallomurus sp. CA-142502 TaxID=3239885 RepID=UPI003D8E4D31